MYRPRVLVLAACIAAGLALSAPAPATGHLGPVASLPGATGSTIGPAGDLFVASPGTGTIYRIDRHTRAVTTFHTGLPAQVIPLGGVMDVAFQGATAYALVTLVGADVGGSDTVGIYRLDGPTTATPVADLGAWSAANPPPTDFFVPSGLQYAFEAYRGGFLVTDGHHNRVLWVSPSGAISDFVVLDNVVPTGLDVHGDSVLLAEAGPVPHVPADGRVVAVDARTRTVTGVAAGAPLLVDVERGRGTAVYALSQGTFPGGDPGAPASPDTGALTRVQSDGSLAVVATGLDRPTSLEVQGDTAYVVGMTGDVVAVGLDR